jgi:glycosyltransferase involved in cell wall biosynthesis
MADSRNSPLVSVIMNAHNSETFLAEALASVVAQSYANWEVVLWDNASTDGSCDIAESLGDARIRYYEAPEKVSLYESRMHAFRQARGEFVAFLDCDDTWSSSKIERQLGAFDDPSCTVSCTDNFVVREEAEVDHAGSRAGRVLETYSEPVNSVVELVMDYRVCMSTVMARSAVAKRVWPEHPPSYSMIEDLDMVSRLVKEGSLVPIPESLTSYRTHVNNYSLKIDLHKGEWSDWLDRLDELGLTPQEATKVRLATEERLLRQECLRARMAGHRLEALTFALRLPMSWTTVKYWAITIAPTGLINAVVYRERP